MNPAPMQNIRAVSFRVDALLAPPRRPGGRRLAATSAVRVLDALHFLGLRLAAIEGATPGSATFADLQAAKLGAYFELLHPAAPLPVLAAALRLATADVLHAGTDLQTDVNAALAVGMRAAWLAPNTHFHPKGAAIVLRTLADLPELLRMADTAHLQCKPGSWATRSLVAMLRGTDEDLPPGPGRRHYDPERRIGDLILDVAAKLRSELGPMEVLRERWQELIGKPALAATSAPEKISPTGVLCIHCSDTITREELRRWHSKRLLETVMRLPACAKIRSLNFHV